VDRAGRVVPADLVGQEVRTSRVDLAGRVDQAVQEAHCRGTLAAPTRAGHLDSLAGGPGRPVGPVDRTHPAKAIP
jgi:hypothetical protein